MKSVKLLILACLIVAAAWLCGLTGCTAPQAQAWHDWTCETAADALAAYELAETAGLGSDAQTIAAVKIAAAFLHGYCGWPVTSPRSSGPGDAGPPAMDRNGVLRVVPP